MYQTGWVCQIPMKGYSFISAAYDIKDSNMIWNISWFLQNKKHAIFSYAKDASRECKRLMLFFEVVKKAFIRCLLAFPFIDQISAWTIKYDSTIRHQAWISFLGFFFFCKEKLQMFQNMRFLTVFFFSWLFIHSYNESLRVTGQYHEPFLTFVMWYSPRLYIISYCFFHLFISIFCLFSSF